MVSGPQSAWNLLLSTSLQFCFASLKATRNVLQTWQRRSSMHASCDSCQHIVRELYNQLQLKLRHFSIPRVRSGHRHVTDLTCGPVKTDPDSSAHNLCKRLQTLQAPKRQSVPSQLACSVFESGTMQYGRLLVSALLPIRCIIN